jgi:outer membrane immunogenic protein
MKKLLGGIALSLLLAAPAVAADMRMPVKAPIAAPAASYNWNGFYTGLHCGGAWGRSRHTGDDGAYDEAGPERYNLKPSGVVCGYQSGFNIHQGSWLFGIESQFGYLGAKKTITEIASPDNQNEVKYRYYGALTGRLGVVHNNTLFYGKGGLAYARIRNTAGDTLAVTGILDPNDAVSVTKTRIGWAAGGGIEYGLAPQWSIKAEYLYMGFGTHSAINSQGDVFTFRNSAHTATFGINYRWGGGGIVARN